MRNNFFNERNFSSAMFFCRIVICAAFIYIFLGIFLHLRSFAENVAVFSGLASLSVYAAFAFCALGLFSSAGILLGYRTRLNAWLLLIMMAIGFFVFEANSFDKLYFAFMLLCLSALAPLIVMGPGAISLDYKRAMEKERKFLSR